MKNHLTRKFLFLVTYIIIVSFSGHDTPFSGRIVSINTFTDLHLNNIGKQLYPYFGKELYYYIDSKNYKTYNERQQLMYLYNSATTTHYSFDKKSKTASKNDVTLKSTTPTIFTKLPNKETIAGYECEAIQARQGKVITTYFYSPKLKLNYNAFLNHEFGEWNAYLKETDGALPLKFTMKDFEKGYIWTNEAVEVKQMHLTDEDFRFPSQYRLQN
ncbi:MAG TPA: DUF4412 domain-containing protein [Segetibacter sp.]|jgi:hypothetical protein